MPIDLLQGIKLLERRGSCLFYRGPNVFPAWEREQIAKFGAEEGGVSPCRVALKTLKASSIKHLFSKKARKRMRKMLRGERANMHANKLMQRVAAIKAKLPPGFVMNAEQKRSLHHLAAGTICRYIRTNYLIHRFES